MDRLLALLIKLFIFLSGFAKPLSRIGIGNYEEWAPGKKLKLLMVGYNGARNTGADARVVAAVRQIKELFGAENVHISVLTLSVESLDGYFDEDVELLKLNSIFLKDLYRACSSHHAAVICEGSALKSTFANALSLFFCEASGIMAKQGKPCIAFGSEVGYMEESLRRFAAKACKGTYFITRTQESQKVLTELGLEGHKGTDIAWLYEGAAEHETTCELLREHGWDGSTPLLGIAVINPFLWPVRASLGKWIKGGITGTQEGQYDKWYYYSDSPQRRSDYERYIDEIAKAANSLCKRGEFFPVLLGMERMDIEACKSLMQKLEMPAAIFASGDYTADIMTGILRELSALITSRYHAAVLSMQKGCPIVAVSMDERLDSLMKEVELEDAYLFHVRDEDLGTELMNAVQKGRNRSQQLREHLEHKVRAYREEQKKRIQGRTEKDGSIPETLYHRQTGKHTGRNKALKETVFVSGATGFLGTEVVSRLLTETDADIYVLVRAEDEEAARARLRNAWHHEENLYRQIDGPSGDPTDAPSSDPTDNQIGASTNAPTCGRVHPAAGDFTMPGLGLSEKMRQLLTEQVTHVFHCGAEIGFQQDEKTLKETNCKGTENMVAFAKAMLQLKRFVHVSTAYVAGQKTGVITEEELPATHFSSLYEKSKAEAEYIVMTAGLPYAICRPGMIVGDSRTGRVKNFNTIYYVLKMILLGKLRVIPTRGDTRLNLVPVDHVADAVVKIGLAESAEGKTYHLTCSTHLQPRGDELLQYVRKWAKENLDTDIPKPAFVPLHGLKKAGLAYNKRQEDRRKNYLSNLLTLLPYFYGGQDFSRKNTDAVAGPYDLYWRDYIDRILAFACHKNFMQQTDRTVFQQAQVRRKSGRYSITYHDVTAEGITPVSGAEANERIEQAAGALWADGVRPGERVALSGINSVAYMILEQAIGLIGAVSVPIYYTTPAEELSLLLQRSGARWLFVGDTRIAEQLGDIPQTVRTISFSVADPSPQPGVVSWDTFLAGGKEPAPAVHPGPDDLATIRYTSGTTGEPKGVMFTFAQLAWMGEVLTGLLPWEERNRSMRYLSFLPLSHVVEGILAAYAPYYMLAKSDIYYLNDFGALTDALPKVRPSVFFSVPRFYEKVWEKTAESSAYKKWSGMKDGRAKALMTAVLRRGVLKKAGLDACSQLIVGSAPVSEALLRNFRDIGIEIHNAYGQTEAPLITINRLGDNVIPTIGTPLPDTEVTVTDAGELLVKGPQVMTGYYGMETDCLEDGILRTGDLGTIHANGHITLTGRKKEMIVTAYGKNISIPKIEERLKNIPQVTEAVLIGEDRPYCTALLWVQGGENREEEATRIVAQIKAMNEELSHPEQVKKFKVIERPLSIQSGELTPNLKVKRRNIEKHFKEIIEEMYS